MTTEPTVAERVEAARTRIFEAELKAATAAVRLEAEEAEERAVRAETSASYLRRRVDELEGALGRRTRLPGRADRRARAVRR